MAKKLFVGNLSWNTTDDSLRDFFSQVGNVISASVITDRMSGRSRGFGFVEMEDADAEKAKKELNGKELDGRAISVNDARPQEESRGQDRGEGCRDRKGSRHAHAAGPRHRQAGDLQTHVSALHHQFVAAGGVARLRFSAESHDEDCAEALRRRRSRRGAGGVDHLHANGLLQPVPGGPGGRAPVHRAGVRPGIPAREAKCLQEPGRGAGGARSHPPDRRESHA